MVHIIGWGAVFIAAVGLNYFHLINRVKKVIEDASLLTSPVLDPLLPLLIGGVMTLALIAQGSCDILFGVWSALRDRGRPSSGRRVDTFEGHVIDDPGRSQHS